MVIGKNKAGNPDSKTSIYVGDSIEEYILTDLVGLKFIWIARNNIISFPSDRINPSLILSNLDGLANIIKDYIYQN